jgi:hypothetical protein
MQVMLYKRMKPKLKKIIKLRWSNRQKLTNFKTTIIVRFKIKIVIRSKTVAKIQDLLSIDNRQ